MTMSGDIPAVQLTVEEKICLHLLENNHLRSQYIMPETVSQNGIAESVGVQRGHASVALISLKSKGLIEEKVNRVEGSSRRKKVYFLTDSGREEGSKIRRHVEESTVPVVEDGASVEHTMREIRNSLAVPLPLVDIVNNVQRFIIENGAVVLESIHPDPGVGKGTDARTGDGDQESVDHGVAPGPESRAPREREPVHGETGDAGSAPEGGPKGGPMGEPMGGPKGVPEDGPEHELTGHGPGALERLPPPERMYPHGSIRSDRHRRFSTRQLSVIIGMFSAALTLFFLWYALENDHVGVHILSYLMLMLAIGALNADSFKRYPPDWKVVVSLLDMVLLISSLMLLTLVMQFSIDGSIKGEEVGQALVVITPLLVLIRAPQIIPDHLKLKIAGIAGTLIILYGLSQTAFTYFQGEMHYPFLWVLGGFLISVNGYFSAQPDPLKLELIIPGDGEEDMVSKGEKTEDRDDVGDEQEGEDRDEDGEEGGEKERDEKEAEEKIVDEDEIDEDGVEKIEVGEGGVEKRGDGDDPSTLPSDVAFAELVTSSCIGAGIFILISLAALVPDIEFEGLTTFLVIIWTIFALMLILIGNRRETGGSTLMLLLSSLIVLTGLLFFFAAWVFITLDKYIEAVMEVLVGLIILRFSLHYISTRKEHLIFTAILVLVGMLSVYQIYLNI